MCVRETERTHFVLCMFVNVSVFVNVSIYFLEITDLMRHNS